MSKRVVHNVVVDTIATPPEIISEEVEKLLEPPLMLPQRNIDNASMEETTSGSAAVINLINESSSSDIELRNLIPEYGKKRQN